MEKIIKKHIEQFLIKTNQIKTSQHGFIKGRSCLSNLLICQNDIINLLDEGSAVDIVYLDLQKAFDKVPHNILMQKIHSMGIGGRVAKWIKNWLTNRMQRVIVNGAHSEWKEVDSGVPQGSILGPLLFTIFINDLDDDVRNPLLKFADDTKLWGAVDSVEGIMRLQNDLDIISNWSKENLMPFNVSKCKVMHIGSRNTRASYSIMNQKNSETKDEKDLGVFFTETFKPSLYCNKACKAANKIIGLIRRSVENKSKEGMLTLYKTLVRPVLD